MDFISGLRITILYVIRTLKNEYQSEMGVVYFEIYFIAACHLTVIRLKNEEKRRRKYLKNRVTSKKAISVLIAMCLLVTQILSLSLSAAAEEEAVPVNAALAEKEGSSTASSAVPPGVWM